MYLKVLVEISILNHQVTGYYREWKINLQMSEKSQTSKQTNTYKHLQGMPCIKELGVKI